VSTDITSLALNWMAAHGAPVVAGLLFLGAIGLPLPGTFLVIASGAFIRQSLLDGTYTPIFGYLGTIAGDAVLYSIGLLASRPIALRFGQTTAWKNALDLFERRGGIAIYLTRWCSPPSPSRSL
jgi:membrane-associated protein